MSKVFAVASGKGGVGKSVLTANLAAALASNGTRVLIVDDMRVNRMILSSLLASNGVLADLAESGEECLALCRENRTT